MADISKIILPGGSEYNLKDAAAQRKITASGVLQGDGSGNISAKPVDTAPTANSTNLVTSGGVKSAIANAVVANPTVAGTEADLTALEVGGTKYIVPSGGSGDGNPSFINLGSFTTLAGLGTLLDTQSAAMKSFSAALVRVTAGATVAPFVNTYLYYGVFNKNASAGSYASIILCPAGQESAVLCRRSLDDGWTFQKVATMNEVAPTSHASSSTTYGAGTNSNYGHLRLSASTSSTSGTSGGYAATPSAVKSAYDLANTKIDKDDVIIPISSPAGVNVPARSYVMYSGTVYGVTSAISSTETYSTFSSKLRTLPSGVANSLAAASYRAPYLITDYRSSYSQTYEIALDGQYFTSAISGMVFYIDYANSIVDLYFVAMVTANTTRFFRITNNNQTNYITGMEWNTSTNIITITFNNSVGYVEIDMYLRRNGSFWDL